MSLRGDGITAFIVIVDGIFFNSSSFGFNLLNWNRSDVVSTFCIIIFILINLLNTSLLCPWSAIKVNLKCFCTLYLMNFAP